MGNRIEYTFLHTSKDSFELSSYIPTHFYLKAAVPTNPADNLHFDVSNLKQFFLSLFLSKIFGQREVSHTHKKKKKKERDIWVTSDVTTMLSL